MKELELLCSLRTHHDRVQGLIDLLAQHPIEIDQYKEPKCNIYCYLDRGKDHMVALTSHHDIVNQASENCLDNNASIYNLLKLLDELDRPRLQYNTLIAFVDEEETGGGGIRRLMDRWRFDWHLDLELTATGSCWCFHPYFDCPFLSDSDFHYRWLPGNNAWLANEYAKSIGRPYSGACLMMMDEEGFLGDIYDNWWKIHTDEDCLALADEAEMQKMRAHLAELLYRETHVLKSLKSQLPEGWKTDW